LIGWCQEQQLHKLRERRRKQKLNEAEQKVIRKPKASKEGTRLQTARSDRAGARSHSDALERASKEG
jgi:hypothetical protein